MRRRAGLIAFILVGAGCKAESPNINPVVKPDAAVSKLEAPRLASDIPAFTPLRSVAVRGKTTGSNVVVKGGAGAPVVRSPLPSGDFCVDVPLTPNTEATLVIAALGEGQISPEVTRRVTQEENSPPPPNPYCERPPCGEGGCPEKETDCKNAKDDDLDGWTDDCDLDCSACVEDYFSPNAYPANVPSVAAGTYDLKLCPCHDDWFAFQLAQNGKVDVKVTFSSSLINIDLQLFRAADAEDGGYKLKQPVKSSALDTSNEFIWYVSSRTDTYYLRIYPRIPKRSGTYRLTIY